MLKAFQLIAYGATAGWLGGVFSVLPSLAMLGVLAALYSVYLIYRGVSGAHACAAGEGGGLHTAALIACGVVAALVVGLVTSLVTPRPGGLAGWGSAVGTGPLGRTAADAPVNITLPGTGITIDTAKVEAANRRMEEPSRAAATQAAGQAMGDMMSAALGGKGGAPLAPETLRAMLPEALGEYAPHGSWRRAAAAMGIQFTNVSAQ